MYAIDSDSEPKKWASGDQFLKNIIISTTSIIIIIIRGMDLLVWRILTLDQERKFQESGLLAAVNTINWL